MFGRAVTSSLSAARVSVLPKLRRATAFSTLVSAAAASGGRSGSLKWVSAAVAGCASVAAVMTTVSCAKAKNDASFFDVSTADNMHDMPNRHPPKETYDFVKALAGKHEKDARVQWRLARAAYSYSEDLDTPKDQKKPLMDEAVAAIAFSQQLDGNDSDMHRWYGIILTGAGQYQGSKEYIANSFQMRDHWVQAVELNPNDASAHHLLGRWAFDVASMSWVKRQMAAALFATPPTASYDEALLYFRDAERISPGFWKKNQVMLAKTLLQLGKKDEAVTWLESAVELTIKTTEDQTAHDEATALLAKHKK